MSRQELWTGGIDLAAVEHERQGCLDVGPCDSISCLGCAFYSEENLAIAKEQAGLNKTTEEHTGGSSSYYKVHVAHPTTLPEAYDAECNDIIEALDMTFAEANVFKATWRTAAARLGKKKKGNDAVYDADKVIFFGGRMKVHALKITT